MGGIYSKESLQLPAFCIYLLGGVIAETYLLSLNFPSREMRGQWLSVAWCLGAMRGRGAAESHSDIISLPAAGTLPGA